jgi:DNA repair ATPase RecN
MIDRFGDRIHELETVVREIAIDITTGTVVDRLPPQQVWDKTGPKVTLVRELLKELREYLFIMKPEKVPSIQKNVTSILERFDLFQDMLTVNVKGNEAPPGAVEELRQALNDISDFVSLCRAIRAEPSEIIQSILSLREGQKIDAPAMNQERLLFLGELIRKTQSSYQEMVKQTAQIEQQLNALKTEYDALHYNIKKMEEE